MLKKYSIPVSNIDVTDLGDNFLNLKIYAISTGENNNGSEFLEESFEPSIPSFYNKPILAYFNPLLGDVEEHNSKMKIDKNGEVFEDFQYEGGEKPVGLIPESAIIQVEDFQGKKWITITGALIWSDYSKQLVDLIKQNKTKKVSVEVQFLDSYMVGNVEKVRLFEFFGVTILGDKYSAGIDGAHLTLQDVAETEQFKNYRQALCFAMKKTDKIDVLSKYGINNGSGYMNTFISKDEYGTGNALKVDKSKDSVSNTGWGSIDKTALRNKVLKAKNYKSLVKDVYLDVQSGWEESPSEKLKYPVMQVSGDSVVYNAGGLLSAQQYGEKYDSAVAKKALSIRKKLGLVKSEKEAKMKEFIESAKSQGMSFIGLFDNKLRFVEEQKCDEDVEKEEMAKKAEMAIFEIEKEKCGEEFKKEDCRQLKMKAFDEDEEDEEEEDDDDIDVEEDPDKKKDKDTEAKKKCRETEKKAKMAEEDKKKMADELEKCKKELKEIKKAQMKAKADECFAKDECLSEEDKAKMAKDIECDKFASVDEFLKEYAYVRFLKEEKKKEEAKKFKYSFSGSVKSSKSESDDPLDRI